MQPVTSLTMTQPARQSLSTHIRRTLVLAWPMVLSRVGIIAMNTVDVIVLGRAGSDHLAHYVLGLTIYDSLTAFVIGLLLGVPVLVARETGAANEAAAAGIWRRGMVFGVAVSLALCLALQFAEPLYRAAGQTPDLARAAGDVTRVLAAGLPFLAAYYVSISFFEALHRPHIGLIVVALGNLANLALNLALVLGLGPFPALGAVGCAMATVLTLALMAGTGLLLVSFGLAERVRFGFGPGARAPAMPPSGAEMARIGAASGGSFLLEASAFAVLTLFIGWLGTTALAAHGVLFQFLALTFMVAYGIGGATQVRVGNAWGRRDPHGMAMAGWTGLALSLVFTSAAALAIAAAPRTAIGVFTSDPAILAAATGPMLWLLLTIAFDGGQTVVNSACRGRGDTWIPTALHFTSYWLVMIPGAWLFAFPLGNGLSGIYIGMLAASIVSITILATRFAYLTRSD